jgi:hypothetical protein
MTAMNWHPPTEKPTSAALKTIGQQIVDAHEADMIAEPCELADRIDRAIASECEAPIWQTKLPFEIERGDGMLIAKAMRAYRPETSEEEGVVLFFIEQFEKLDQPNN